MSRENEGRMHKSGSGVWLGQPVTLLGDSSRPIPALRRRRSEFGQVWVLGTRTIFYSTLQKKYINGTAKLEEFYSGLGKLQVTLNVGGLRKLPLVYAA